MIATCCGRQSAPRTHREARHEPFRERARSGAQPPLKAGVLPQHGGSRRPSGNTVGSGHIRFRLRRARMTFQDRSKSGRDQTRLLDRPRRCRELIQGVQRRGCVPREEKRLFEHSRCADISLAPGTERSLASREIDITGWGNQRAGPTWSFAAAVLGCAIARVEPLPQRAGAHFRAGGCNKVSRKIGKNSVVCDRDRLLLCPERVPPSSECDRRSLRLCVACARMRPSVALCQPATPALHPPVKVQLLGVARRAPLRPCEPVSDVADQ